jgi:hypothetical protein
VWDDFGADEDCSGDRRARSRRKPEVETLLVALLRSNALRTWVEDEISLAIRWSLLQLSFALALYDHSAFRQLNRHSRLL